MFLCSTNGDILPLLESLRGNLGDDLGVPLGDGNCSSSPRVTFLKVLMS